MELMDIPFIGSSSQRTVLAMNKTMTRSMMIECGIPCPPGKIIFEDTIFNSDNIEYPCVVKPTTTENSGKFLNFLNLLNFFYMRSIVSNNHEDSVS
jgi:carbamoylphosphate synthase large subunit